MNEYVEYMKIWWAGLTQVGRTVISALAIVAALVGFGLILLNAVAFDQVVNSLSKLLPF